MLTVYGIETVKDWQFNAGIFYFTLQQCLPFTVLKRSGRFISVAVYKGCNSAYRLRYWNCEWYDWPSILSSLPLQQCLPFTVLKRIIPPGHPVFWVVLQQCLPFTVLKLTSNTTSTCTTISSCNSAYRLRYWNKYLESESPDIFKLQQCLPFTVLKLEGFSEFTFRYFRCCNSAYRLRYWNAILKWNTLSISVGLQQCLPFTVLKPSGFAVFATSDWSCNIPTVYGIETRNQSTRKLFLVSCNSTYRLRYWNAVCALQPAQTQSGCNSTYRLRYWNAVSIL